MNLNDYNSQFHKNRFYRAVRAGIITLAVCLFLIAPGIYFWRLSVIRRLTLREAKNVVLNMNLLAAEFVASGNPVRDFSRDSGITKEAEERIRSCAAATGDIKLVAWDTTEAHVSVVTYAKGRYLVEYRYVEDEDRNEWRVYTLIREYLNKEKEDK